MEEASVLNVYFCHMAELIHSVNMICEHLACLSVRVQRHRADTSARALFAWVAGHCVKILCPVPGPPLSVLIFFLVVCFLFCFFDSILFPLVFVTQFYWVDIRANKAM